MYEYFLQNLEGTVFSSENAIGIMTQAFNELGAGKWELVGIYGSVAFFKRELIDKPIMEAKKPEAGCFG